MHITCCASAYQLICKRTTAVVRSEILTNSKTYTIFSNNLYYVFQQHSNKQKRVNHLLMTHPLILLSQYNVGRNTKVVVYVSYIIY
ncbi:hypothetical protein DW262_11855 [Segatella copri]|uniref:Uncharacterized protein n=1 Tax=Segatella copri TaxID=165179 RepID=A0A3R6IBE7_9BACT|nr:hypothetical protein DW263_12325 [Segatella copri]RHG33398.1 hypothetical protein DW262_11855 [Segatella copri]RHG64006.1 hypothetical protein DW250_11680 [Segatella copri]